MIAFSMTNKITPVIFQHITDLMFILCHYAYTF